MACCNSTHGNGSVRAVLYLRMSSDRQETSIGDQRTELEKYAHARGYAIVREFVDEGISGDATERRDGFLAMRDQAASGGFSLVLAWDVDRLGRYDPLDAGYWLYPFRQSGIEFETIAQGRLQLEDLTQQLMFSVVQHGKAQYLRDLSRNSVRGQLAYGRAGARGTGGKAPYGYRDVEGRVSIVPAEAEIVRWIFTQYLEPGSSIRSIAAELNARGVATSKGARIWSQGTVRSILTRRKYTGAFVYGAENSGKYFAGRGGEIVPRRKSDRKAVSEPIVHPDRFEAIIDSETFEATQEKLRLRRLDTRPRQSRFYTLGGLLRCGDCGGTLGGIQRFGIPSYTCRTFLQGGRHACYHNSIEEAPLLAATARKIREHYTSPEARARLRQAILAEQGSPVDRTGDVVRLTAELRRLDRQIDQGAERVLAAPEAIVATLYAKLEKLKSERDRLAVELEALSHRQTRPAESQASEVDRAIAALQAMEETFERGDPVEVRELLQAIVSRIEVHYLHGTRGTKQRTSRFERAEILTRPDLGKCSHLNATSP